MPRRSESKAFRLEWVPTQPVSGYVRVPGNDPCEIRVRGDVRKGTVWNISVLGVFVAIDPPLPSIGDLLELSFRISQDPEPVSCKARVAWLNPPSVMFRDVGGVSAGLPPGCGLHFVVLAPDDQARLEKHVKVFHRATE